MKRFAMLAVLVVLVSCGTAVAADKVALVVGNGDYLGAPLKNPVNDAFAMHTALRSMGFESTLLVDADRRKFLTAMDAFIRQIGKADIGLVYYAGHGFQYDGENYLVPVDVDFGGQYDIAFDCVGLKDVLNSMNGSGCKNKVIILDSCRNSPYLEQVRGVRVTPSALDAPINSFIAFATSPGKTAADGKGMHSVFTASLLKELKAGGEIEQILKSVRSDVYDSSSGRQLPWHTSSLVSSVQLTSSSAVLKEKISIDIGLYREDEEGRPALVKDGEALKSGDGYFLYVRPALESYVYIYQKDVSGEVFRLFPNKSYGTGQNPLAPEGQYIPNPDSVFYLDENVGREQIFVFAGKRPIDYFERNTEILEKDIQQVRLMGPAGVRKKESRLGRKRKVRTVTNEYSNDSGFLSYEIDFVHE